MAARKLFSLWLSILSLIETPGAEILGIVQTKKANGPGQTIEMAGFPHHALDSYLPKLVRAGKRVAICDQLQATHRKLIEAYIAVFFDTGKRGDMRNMGVLRLIQIIQDGPRSYDSQFQMLDTETFQVLRFEMFQKTVVGSFRSKHPVIQFKNKEPSS